MFCVDDGRNSGAYRYCTVRGETRLTSCFFSSQTLFRAFAEVDKKLIRAVSISPDADVCCCFLLHLRMLVSADGELEDSLQYLFYHMQLKVMTHVLHALVQKIHCNTRSCRVSIFDSGLEVLHSLRDEMRMLLQQLDYLYDASRITLAVPGVCRAAHYRGFQLLRRFKHCNRHNFLTKHIVSIQKKHVPRNLCRDRTPNDVTANESEKVIICGVDCDWARPTETNVPGPTRDLAFAQARRH